MKDDITFDKQFDLELRKAEKNVAPNGTALLFMGQNRGHEEDWEKKNLDNIKMWYWRKMEKLMWTDKKSDHAVLRQDNKS